MLRRALVFAWTGFALCLALPTASARDFGFKPEFSIGGYIGVQSGIFVSNQRNIVQWEDDSKAFFPVDHGGRLGELSMLRATVFLEADWHPWEPISLHVIFRGVRSLTVPSDEREAEPPSLDISDKADWVRDTYYSETDIREIYIDVDVTDWWHLRVGKQQVSWGELGQYRLLDVINPSDTTWHFGPLESFEDTRIPLWMVDSTMEIRPLQGSLEIVWIPLIDEPSRTVTTPLTFVGAWGLPRPPAASSASVRSDRIGRKIFHYPGGDIEDSRIGLRWKGEIGNITYSLAYMYTHQLSPPIPDFYENGPLMVNNNSLLDVHLRYPRQHVAGFSLEIPFESPLGVVARIEAAYEPNRSYATDSLRPEGFGPKFDDEYFQLTGIPRNHFDSRTKHVITYGIQLMRPTMIRALNPTQNFIFVLQFMHEVVLNFDGSEDLISVPGFDTTELKQHTFTVVGVVTTTYLNGMIRPYLIGAYRPPGDGFFSGQLRFVFGNHWRLKLAVNMFWGSDPYNGIGFFRDRDEVNLDIVYQF